MTGPFMKAQSETTACVYHISSDQASFTTVFNEHTLCSRRTIKSLSLFNDMSVQVGLRIKSNPCSGIQINILTTGFVIKITQLSLILDFNDHPSTGFNRSVSAPRRSKVNFVCGTQC